MFAVLKLRIAFSKTFPCSSPAVRRPAAHGPAARDGLAVRGPVLIFHSVLSSGKSTHMRRSASGWACNMDDTEFEFVYHLII